MRISDWSSDVCSSDLVVPMVAAMIVEQMEVLGLEGGDMRRLWLHQANTNMNRLIAQRVLGHEASEDESPTVLDTYRSEERRGGKGCVSTCRSRWSAYH